MTIAEVKSVLSSNRFLTENEIASILDHSLSTQESWFLQNNDQITLFQFYGHRYYRLNVPMPITSLGKQAIDRLTKRPQAIELGQARRCLDHLAGQAGVSLFKNLIQKNIIKAISPVCYTLTPTGYQYMKQWLDYSPEPQIKLCLDFSERDFHIGGVLGNRILAKLVSEGKCQLTENRVVKLTTADMTNLI